MKLIRTCREVTALALRAEDEALPLGDRLAVMLHLPICKACTRFKAQLGLMRAASQQWRRYSETLGETASED